MQTGNDLRAKAVRRVKDPCYPTRLEVLADRTLLQKHMPSAWKSCAEMAGIVTIMLATNNCVAQDKSPVPHSGKAAVVAPIFEHGEGRGATGCVVINAPVFLSEQDAMQVIREELTKSGIALGRENVTLGDVKIPQSREEWSEKNGELNVQARFFGHSKPLVLQGVDPTKKVGVEVVTEEHYFDLGGAQSSSSVQGYDFKQVAKDLRGRASSNRDLYIGVFYDPTGARQDFRHEDPEFRKQLNRLYQEQDKIKDPALKQAKEKEIDALYEKHLEPLKEESRRLLRLQVKDFVDWLKGQGAI